jgi:hypothetical protein
VSRVSKTQNDEKKDLEELVVKRNLLYAQLLKDPSATRPAVEIKAIDDEIAKLRLRK